MTHALTPDQLRLAFFAGMLAAVSGVERVIPRRRRAAPSGRRLFTNLSIMVAGSLLARLVLPFSLAQVAGWAAGAGFGLLHLVRLPRPAAFVAGMVALDLVIYWQHRVFHRVPWLWRLHAVHHTDLDLDGSSGVRFHPFEIVLSLLIKMSAIALLGVDAATVLWFEVVLNACSIFNHGNMALPGDRWLRLLLVTPDMHRVHHTPNRDEHDSNFSFNVPWWDVLFGSYRAQPRGAHETLELGLAEDRDPERLALARLLIRPFERLEDPLRPAHQRRLA